VKNNEIEWPASKLKMSAAGLQYAFRNYQLKQIHESLTLPILTLPVSVYLKILTYSDRNKKKDLEDALYILIHYEEIEISERRFELPDNIIRDYDLCGAYLTGMDLKDIISKKEVTALKVFIMEKIKPDTLTIDYLADKFFETPEYIQNLLSLFIEGLE